MEKKITKKIRKKVAECMSESIDAVEVMQVSEAIGITADAIYAVPGDAVHLAKIIVLGEDEEIDDERLSRIDLRVFGFPLTRLRNAASNFDGDVYCTTVLVWLRTDGSIAHVAIIAKGM